MHRASRDLLANLANMSQQPSPSSQTLRISPADVRERRKVGFLEGADVYHLQTKGGYNVFASLDKKGSSRILGVGPHPAVARFMAQKQNPSMKLTDLCKSAWHQLDQAEIDSMLPAAEAVMSLLNS